MDNEAVERALAHAASLTELVSLAGFSAQDRIKAERALALLINTLPRAGTEPEATVATAAEVIRLLAGFGDAPTLAPAFEAQALAASILTGFDAGMAALFGAAFATVALRLTYKAQPDAVAMRERVARVSASLAEAVGDRLGLPTLDGFLSFTGDVALALSAIAADRSPLIRVETGVSLPSTLLAFELYGDPERAAELVDRNDTGTPLLMPVVLEALAS